MRLVQVEEFESDKPNGQEEHAVLIEPKPGHTDAEIRSALSKAGIFKVRRVSATFLSAEATDSQLCQVETIANIHEKTQIRVR